MLTKEEFVEYMGTLKKMYDSSLMLDSALKNFDNCSDFGGFSNFRAEDLVITLLEKLMDDPKDTTYGISNISYFIYDLEWGTKWAPDSLTEADGSSVDISTPEKLYDYLMSEIDKRLSDDSDI